MKILSTELISIGARYLRKTLTPKTSIFRNEHIYKQINKEKVKCYHCSYFQYTRKNDELKQLAIPVDENLIKSNEVNNNIKISNSLDVSNDDDNDDDEEEYRRRTRKPLGTHLKSGAIRKKPAVNKNGAFNALLLVGLFIFLGGHLSSLAARVLHDYEIFVLPDDEDEFY